MGRDFSGVAPAAAAVGAAASCLLGSCAFLAGRGEGGAALRTPQRFLQASQAQRPAPGAAGLRGVASAGVGVGLAAALAAAARRRTARRAVAEPKMITGPFAGGLVGTEFHGWGAYEFDPLELSKRYPENLPWYREAELKHGRVAMLACVGLVAPDFFRLPLEIFQDDTLDLVNAHNRMIFGLCEGPMWWLFCLCGVVEIRRWQELGLGFEKLTLDNAGDLGWGKAAMPKTDEGRLLMRIKELKNGRLAMLAFSGAITQAVQWDVHHFPFVPGF